jgi:hypothetical protein
MDGRVKTPAQVSARRRLIRSAWSVGAALLVLILLGSFGYMMISAAPLWLWAVPSEPDETIPTADSDADERPAERLDRFP